MKVYLSTAIKPDGATYATAVHKVDSMKLLKRGYFMIMLNERPRCRSVQQLK